MKKILSVSLSALIALASVSCSQSRLDIPQKGVIAIESFYQTEEDAESAVVNIYNAGTYCYNLGAGFSAFVIAPVYFTFANSPSDDLYFGSGNKDDHAYGLEINEYRTSFTSESVVVKSMYMGFYQFIYACNLLLDNYQYGTSEKIDRNISEARVFRALAHMNLAMYWNNPPLVDHVLTGADRPGNTPHADILKWVIDELSDAADYLPSKSGVDDSANAIRLTKEAALSFLGKAQIYAGDYTGAKATLKKVIDSGKYQLYPGEKIGDLFHRAGDGCCEKIFEFNYVNDPNTSYMGFYHFFANNSFYWRTSQIASKPTVTIPGEGWGGISPTGEFARAMIANDGDSYRRKAWILTYDEFLYDLPYPSDIAEDGHELTLEEKQKDLKRGIYPNSTGLYACEGYLHYKFIGRASDLMANETNNCDNNTIIMRYAEVLLLYAEACAMTGDSDKTGLKALNDIQNRAGSEHKSTACTMDEVKNEKRFELWLEGSRFVDLVRWGDAAEKLKNNGKAVPTYKDLITISSDIHKGYVDWTDAYYNGDNYGFKAGKNEYYPYPFSETSINPNIVQNPGW